MKKVYIESSVISYLAARPSNDLIKVARQAITEAWWSENRQSFALYVSELVEEEISQGHPDAAYSPTEYFIRNHKPWCQVPPDYRRVF